MKLRLAVTLCTMMTTAPVFAQPTQATPDGEPPSVAASGPREPKELEAWMDQFLSDYLKTNPQASLGFVLVKDGEVFFKKGYGFADAEKKSPVDPDRTLFFAASVSKVVTATAVMQMIEQGKLRENIDVNTYIKEFQLEKNYPEPVTVANLLTHTAGFDDSFIAASVDRPADLVSLGDFFSRNPPPRARPPGRQIVYSNWGMAFAGYLVEVASGTSYYDYVEQNLFAPLSMTHSSFRRPIPLGVAPHVATAGVGGQPPDKTAIQLYPSEALVSTVTDMGQFLIAHLNGRLGDKRILSDESLGEMHRQHFTQHPHMPGVAYGFFEAYINGQRGLFHTGGGGHESIIYLLPERDLGFYLVYSGDLENNFVQAFLDHYYPAHPFAFPAAAADFEPRAHQFNGVYRPGFIASRGIEKLIGLAADTRVVSNGDGTLTVSLPPLGSTKFRIAEVEPVLFRSEEGYYVTFARDKAGNVTGMFTSGSTKDPAAYHKLHWYESGLLNAGLAAVGLMTLLSFPIVSIIGYFRKRGRTISAQPGPTSNMPRLAWGAGLVVSLLALLSPVPIIAWALFGDHSRPSQFKSVLPVTMSALLLASVVALTLPIFSYISWTRQFWSVARRIYYSEVAFVAFLMIPFLHYWNLLGL